MIRSPKFRDDSKSTIRRVVTHRNRALGARTMHWNQVSFCGFTCPWSLAHFLFILCVCRDAGKTPEEIRKRFNIQNDFTPDEEEAVRAENKWAEES